MKITVLCPVLAVAGLALSSCNQMQPTSSRSKSAANSGAGAYGSAQGNTSYQGANPYGSNPSYTQYQQSADSYSSDSDYVNVTPASPQHANASPQYQAAYQPPAAPNPQMGAYQGAAQPYAQPSYQPLPLPQKQQASSNAGGVAQSHVVQQGETLYRISRIYGSTVDGIKGVNGLNSDIIHPGDVLNIP